MPRDQSTSQVLFSRGSQDGDSTADDWDDTELLKEYDRAVRPLKVLVAERMGLSKAEREEASATESGSSRSVVEKEALKNLKRSQRKRRRKGKNKQHREWAAGDHCSAKYTVDEQWYEATVVSIDHDRGTCTVQYVGYGNSEEQPLSALSHSMGAAVRREQSNAATLKPDDAETTQSDDLMERSSEASSTISQLSKVGLSDSKCKSLNADKLRNSSFPPQIPQSPSGPSNSGGTRPGFPNLAGLAAHSAVNDMVPPPLPPHILASLPGDDSEALSAMLMSWYMSGFHTGYYQGLKKAKNFSHS